MIIIIIHALLQTLLLLHLIAVDIKCILFNRVVLNRLTLHEKFGLGLEKKVLYTSTGTTYAVTDVYLALTMHVLCRNGQ